MGQTESEISFFQFIFWSQPPPLLIKRAAVDKAWSLKPQSVLVNTNNGDHPRAMPNYRRAGFVPYRTLTETWHIPNYLRLEVPDHLRVAVNPD